MSVESFRSAVHSAIESWRVANFPDTDCAYENGPVPEEAVVSTPWLDVEVKWYGGTNLGVGQPKSGRFSGVVSVRCYTREGTGTAATDQLLDSLAFALSGKRMQGGTLLFPQPYTPTKALGWYKRGLMFPFKLDV